MFESLTRSWKVAKVSWKVLVADKELLAFPILGGLFSLLWIAATFIPLFFIGLMDNQIVFYSILFVIYLGLSFLMTFFNTCVVYTTKTRIEGGNATFGSSISFAFSRLDKIIMWALVSATMGLIFRLLENAANRLEGFGRQIALFVIGLFGAAWSIATIFVVPVLVYKNLTPFDALKESVLTLKKTFGESLTRYYGLGLIQFLLMLVGVIGCIVAFVLLGSVSGKALLIFIPFAVLYFTAVSLLCSLFSTIFNTILYAYATTGKVPLDADEEVVKHAIA